jgi:hypothetical protein
LRIILILDALVFAVFGVLTLFWPVAMMSTLGITFAEPAGVTDIRATYGGYELGMAMFLAW